MPSMCVIEICGVPLCLQPRHLTSSPWRDWGCVFWEQANICQPTSSRATAVSVFPMQMLFRTDGFVAWVFRRCLSAASLFCCTVISSHFGFHFLNLPLFSINLKCVLVLLCRHTVYCRSGQCSLACGLVCTGCPWEIAAAVDLASIVWLETFGTKRQQKYFSLSVFIS